MADEIDTLLARARRLEEENTLLRSMQSPTGDDAALQAENVRLRTELERIRRSRGGAPAAPEEAQPPRTLDEFKALPPARREAAARQMTRRQRDELLGRNGTGDDRANYL